MYKTFLKIVVVVLPVLFFILTAGSAQAATFVVNSTADTADFSLGDGVCDTNDSANDGPCTFRAAISQANATVGHDTITFSVTGTITATGNSFTSVDNTGVTITGPGSGLLTINAAGMALTPFLGNTAAMHFTGDNNIVSGFTLTGSGTGIFLSGSDDNTFSDVAVTNNSTYGIRLATSDRNEFDAMTISGNSSAGFYFGAGSDNNTISNSTFSNNTSSGVFLDTANNNTFTTNVFTAPGNNAFNLFAPTGTVIEGNTITGAFTSGVLINSGTGATTINNNTISGATSDGIAVVGSSGVITITNNTVSGNNTGIALSNSAVSDGTIISGNTVTGNNTGIGVGSIVTNTTITNNTIHNNNNYGINSAGNGVTITGNTISGTDGSVNSAGIQIGGNNYVVRGNNIGTNSSAVITSGYGNSYGIFLNAFSQAVSNVQIGGTSASDKNIIAGNTIGGILSLEWPAKAVTFSALGNTIYSNGANLGIDLAWIDGSFTVFSQGVTANDAGDADTGSNGLLNTPVINTADPTVDILTYTLDVPAGNYRVEFFKNPITGTYGEGQTFLGYDTFVSTGVSKLLAISNIPISPGDYITATATQDLGGGNYGATSEFSQVIVPPVVIPSATAAVSGGVVSVVRVCNDPKAINYSTQAGFGDNTVCQYGAAVTTPATTPSMSCPVFAGNYKRGTQGAAVVKIQTFLSKEVDAKLPTNGIFGPLTEKAVKKFQTKYAATILGGIAPTGNWYAKTTAQANLLSGCK